MTTPALLLLLIMTLACLLLLAVLALLLLSTYSNGLSGSALALRIAHSAFMRWVNMATKPTVPTIMYYSLVFLLVFAGVLSALLIPLSPTGIIVVIFASWWAIAGIVVTLTWVRSLRTRALIARDMSLKK